MFDYEKNLQGHYDKKFISIRVSKYLKSSIF